MENASKALIIAGAILLAILIISLGIMIYNQASGVVNNNSMSEVDISTFNQKFTQYEGDHVRGAQVNALLEQIRTNNVTYSDDNSRKVSVDASSASFNGGNGPKGTLDDGNGYKKASTGKTYKVTSTINKKTGLIYQVNIVDDNSK